MHVFAKIAISRLWNFLKNCQYSLVQCATLVAMLIAVGVAFAPDQTLEDALAEMGYVHIAPPTTFHGPGTFNSVETLHNGSKQLHPTCDMNFDPALWRESPTENRQIQKQLSVGLNSVPKNLLSKLGLSGERIKDVHISLSNTQILLLSDETLLDLQKRYLKGSCEQAVIHNVENQACVGQTKAVLKADAVYTISYYDQLKNDGQLTWAKEIVSTLGMDAQSLTEKTGEGLFYGARLSKCLLTTKSVGGLASFVTQLFRS